MPRGEAEGELDMEGRFTGRERNQMSVETCYCLVAAAEAVEQAGWQPTAEPDRCRTGQQISWKMNCLKLKASFAIQCDAIYYTNFVIKKQN